MSRTKCRLCDRPVISHGLCALHHARARKQGIDPTTQIDELRRTIGGPVLTPAEVTAIARAARWPSASSPALRAEDGPATAVTCAVPGCLDPATGRGVCRPHYLTAKSRATRPISDVDLPELVALASRPPRRRGRKPSAAPCAVPGCTGYSTLHGMCRAHAGAVQYRIQSGQIAPPRDDAGWVREAVALRPAGTPGRSVTWTLGGGVVATLTIQGRPSAGQVDDLGTLCAIHLRALGRDLPQEQR